MSRRRILAILDGEDERYGLLGRFSVDALILCSAVAVAAETVPSLDPDWRAALAVFEIVAASLFAAEYGARLACSPRPLRYAASFWGVIDLVSFLPTLVFAGTDTIAIRVLRLLRAFRVVKFARHARALHRLGEAVVEVRHELVSFLFAMALLLFLCAVGIHHFEHEAQPEAFSSIPASLWWAIATLTTVGYGDVVPVTVGGRIFTGAVLVIGIGVAAAPTGLIASALAVRRPGSDKAAGDGGTDETRDGGEGRNDGDPRG